MDATVKILEDVKNGSLSVDEAVLLLKKQPFEDLGFAKVDLHRKLRQGAAEVIYGAGKTTEQIAKIVLSLQKNGQEEILITRLSKEKAEQVQQHLAGVVSTASDKGGSSDLWKEASPDFRFYETAGIGFVGTRPEPDGLGTIVVAAAGTSDLPVAEEAAVTAELLGNKVVRLYDVGVAGIHRLLSHNDDIMTASVVIAVAGMEGALASVIGGLADCPVIAVPTSVGYGAAFEGLSALLSMLNSCASGVSVVNIDNGFGAGYQASMINHMKKR